MTVSLKTMMDKLPAGRRKRVEKRAGELIEEEMRLRELREAFALSQERVAERMETAQETVSRIEAQSKDMRVSSIAKYLAALGGELQLVARFPDRNVVLRDLAPLRPSRGKMAARRGRASSG